jgi:hypothetical protein
MFRQVSKPTSYLVAVSVQRVRAVEQEGIDYADRVISVSGRLCDEVKSQFHCDDKIR